jgi:3-hydroxyisobutyrate dehydrogenase
MVGGDGAAFARVRPLFERMGTTIVHQGPAGSGQHTKMVNQILIATGMIGVCEALLYARRSGLDVPTVLASVSGGAAGSWSLTNYVPRIERGDLEPGFMIEHFVKDMRIALTESRRMGLTLPGLELAERLYAGLVAAGHGRKGIQALLLALDRV